MKNGLDNECYTELCHCSRRLDSSPWRIVAHSLCTFMGITSIGFVITLFLGIWIASYVVSPRPFTTAQEQCQDVLEATPSCAEALAPDAIPWIPRTTGKR